MNIVDLKNSRRNIIGYDGIRGVKLNLMVDCSAYMMIINKTIQSQLELPFIEKRKVQLAGSGVEKYDVEGPITIKFANRKAVCIAFVLQGDNKPLLGAIPMEEMDVVIHPLRQELIVNPEHPNYTVLKMK